ncbi:MAG: energy-coupling factor transporter ATPase [Christensenellales bacterium]
MQIDIKNLSYVYSRNTPFEKIALSDISFSVKEGESVGIIGATGSGKSTLIQHLNGLIRLQSGSLHVFDVDLSAKKPDLKRLRKGVGMLFQYPEYQLFADTVEADVKFGPINFGMNKEEAEQAAKEAVTMVGLDYEEIKSRSPLELSGGQKRRVAIAGILACRPEIMVLDEPTAGLDPAGKKDMLRLISSLKGSFLKSVITVSHNMDEIAEYCDRVILLNNGSLVADSTPAELFYGRNVEELGLAVPHVVKIVRLLRQRGMDLPDLLTEKQLADALIAALGGSRA